MPIETNVAPTQVVGDDEDDVRCPIGRQDSFRSGFPASNPARAKSTNSPTLPWHMTHRSLTTLRAEIRLSANTSPRD